MGRAPAEFQLHEQQGPRAGGPQLLRKMPPQGRAISILLHSASAHLEDLKYRIDLGRSPALFTALAVYNRPVPSMFKLPSLVKNGALVVGAGLMSAGPAFAADNR